MPSKLQVVGLTALLALCAAVSLGCNPESFRTLAGTANVVSLQPTPAPLGFGVEVSSLSGTLHGVAVDRAIVIARNETRSIVPYYALSAISRVGATQPASTELGRVVLNGCSSAECGMGRSGATTGLASFALPGGIQGENCLFTAVLRQGGVKIEVRCESHPAVVHSIESDEPLMPEFVGDAVAASAGNLVVFASANANAGQGGLYAVVGLAGAARLRAVQGQGGPMTFAQLGAGARGFGRALDVVALGDVPLPDAGGTDSGDAGTMARSRESYALIVGGDNTLAVGWIDATDLVEETATVRATFASCVQGEAGHGLGNAVAFGPSGRFVVGDLTGAGDFGAVQVFEMPTRAGTSSNLCNVSSDDLPTARAITCEGDQCTQSRFGASVAMTSGFVYVGAPTAGDNTTRGGAVYAFAASGQGAVTVLRPSTYRSGMRFGESVALVGEASAEPTLVAGAPGASEAFLFLCNGMPSGNNPRCLVRQ